MGQTPLPTAVLGRTGLEVTRLGYGTVPRKHPDDEQWGRILNGVLDSGINFIDTANDHGVREASGPAEEQIGRHIQSPDRSTTWRPSAAAAPTAATPGLERMPFAVSKRAWSA